MGSDRETSARSGSLYSDWASIKKKDSPDSVVAFGSAEDRNKRSFCITLGQRTQGLDRCFLSLYSDWQTIVKKRGSLDSNRPTIGDRDRLVPWLDPDRPMIETKGSVRCDWPTITPTGSLGSDLPTNLKKEFLDAVVGFRSASGRQKGKVGLRSAK